MSAVSLPFLNSAQESAVTSVLANLDSELATAWGMVDGTWAAFGATGSKAAAEAGLNTAFTHIEQLRGTLLQRARVGSYSFSDWAAFAKVVHDEIAYQSGLTGEWSMASVLKNTAAATVDDVGAVVEEVKSAGGGFSVGLALGLLAFGYFAWKAK